MKYEVKLQQFAGPLEKLLELIEEKQLEITQLNLAQVTDDFLKYIKTVEVKMSSVVMADFLVVAAKLVLIKSKALLPSLELTQDEEGEMRDLEFRLKLYREFSLKGGQGGETTASQYILKLWNKKTAAFSRPLLMGYSQTVFYPPKDISVDTLAQAVRNLLTALQSLIPETQKIKSAVVTIEQKIQELLGRFTESAGHTFKNITSARTKSEIIVTFLAVLHLLKDRLIKVEQGQQFGDIIIEKQHG